MTEIDEVIAGCVRAWRRLGVRRDERAAMVDELRADLDAAAAAGGAASTVIGSDPGGFAREWAESRGVVRPPWRVLSTTAAAFAGAVPAAGFALVLPLLSTSEWGIEALVKLFPGQRSRTNLECRLPAGRCPAAYWDPPGWLLATWYLFAAGLAFVGALFAAAWWLGNRADPAAHETRRMLAIGMPLGAVVLGLPMLAANDARPGTWYGNGGWVLVLGCAGVATIASARLLAVVKSRRTTQLSLS